MIKNIYDAIDRVQKYARGVDISTDNFSSVRAELNYIQERIDLTDIQAVIFSVIVELACDTIIASDDIAKHLGISNCSAMTYNNEIIQMETKHLVRRTRERYDGHRKLCYFVPSDVLEVLSSNKKYEPKVPICRSNEELFFAMDYIMRMTSDNEMPVELMEKEMDDLMNKNSSLPLAKGLLKHKQKLATYEYKALILFTLYWIKGNEEIATRDLHFIYDDRQVSYTLAQELENGTSTLIKLGLVEYVNNNGMATRSTYTITPMVKMDTYPKLLSVAKDRNCIVTKCGDIVTKQLFYNPKESEQIKVLSELLQNDRFVEVQKRLSDSGMRNGFTCLFYGAPGTGKTETALQLAKASGRDVMLVNFAEMKNAFVGESEKAVDRVFRMYRRAVKESKIAPIMLIDEADGLMSKRLTNMRDSVDKMENTIQNIILQEMSKIEGICICTTNLSENMDPAMSRRLLYKVHFEKPCLEAKASIWQSMLPDLSEADAMTLAKAYDYSGGQIENIARKRAVDSILYASEVGIDKIREYCEAEEIISDGAKRIGF